MSEWWCSMSLMEFAKLDQVSKRFGIKSFDLEPLEPGRFRLMCKDEQGRSVGTFHGNSPADVVAKAVEGLLKRRTSP